MLFSLCEPEASPDNRLCRIRTFGPRPLRLYQKQPALDSSRRTDGDCHPASHEVAETSQQPGREPIGSEAPDFHELRLHHWTSPFTPSIASSKCGLMDSAFGSEGSRNHSSAWGPQWEDFGWRVPPASEAPPEEPGQGRGHLLDDEEIPPVQVPVSHMARVERLTHSESFEELMAWPGTSCGIAIEDLTDDNGELVM